MNNPIISFLIFYIFFSRKFINCSSDRKKHFGKCVYISTDTGSTIINFHKYKNKDYSPQNKKYSINLCNDTQYDKWVNGTKKLGIDSQIAYYLDPTGSVRLAGPFYVLQNKSLASVSILDKKDEDKYIYKPQFGDFCNNDKKNNYSTSIIFEHKDISNEDVEISEYPNPNDCNPVLKVYYNKEYATDYLLLQKVLNNCFIFTGIIFILGGVYLSFIHFKFPSITKILISVVFGQLIMFNIAMIFIDNNTKLKDYFYILILCLGLVISAPFIYFTRSYEKLYYIILSFSAGYVCGIFIYEIIFFNTNSVLTQSILIDVLLIFTTTFIGLNLIIPRHYIYYPPFIGGYILIRGFSLFIYNISDKGGFGDLHLLIYLIKLQEQDLVDEYFENDYKYFYIYLIFIGLIIIGSDILVYFKGRTDRELSYSDLMEDDSIESSLISMTKLEDK